MTLFDHPTGVAEPTPREPDLVSPDSAPPAKRPRRWSLTNWPVRWKVLAIALVPLVLAAAFGGLRIYSSTQAAQQWRLAADRTEMVPTVASYMAALENALVAATEGGDTKAAVDEYTARRAELTQKLDVTNVIPDVRLAVTTLTNYGKDLLDKVNADSIGLRQRVTTFSPLLLTAETAITSSVEVDNEDIRNQAQGLARAVGSRGQMAMQKMLVNRGGDLSEPELRASMIALAGTEPSTVTGMSQLLGGSSPDAQTLRSQMVQRLSMYSDPTFQLVNSPELTQSLQATSDVAVKLIDGTTGEVTSAVENEATAQRNAAIRDAIAVLAVFLLALLIVWLVARSLTRPLRRLRDGALKVAHEDLPKQIERVYAGEEREPTPLPIYTTEEVGQVAHAVDELHAQALLLAGDEARLRLMVNDMFETMSRRNKTLVDQQLSLIDRLERNEDDADRLDSLFRLDHLATRMRRNGANLLVLAGAAVSHEQSDSVSVASVVSAAASEVEDYRRVETAMVPDCALSGASAGDTVHLLAELIDNALRYSPPTSQVKVSALYTSDAGLLINVEDTGLGMTEADLRIANMRLSAGGEVSPESARHMGLFVVGRLARRHDVIVRLHGGAQGTGTTAEVYVPPELLVTDPAEVLDTGGMPAAAPPQVAFAPPAEAVAVPAQVQPVGLFDSSLSDANLRNGSAPDSDGEDASVTLLPRRTPGSSGITVSPDDVTADETGDGSLPTPWWSRSEGVEEDSSDGTIDTPSNTSGFFSAARTHAVEVPDVDETPAEIADEVQEADAEAAEAAAEDVDEASSEEASAQEVSTEEAAAQEETSADDAAAEATEVVHEEIPQDDVPELIDESIEEEPAEPSTLEQFDTGEIDLSDMDALAAELAPRKSSGIDLIYQNMLSEGLVDPHELAVAQNWKSVWDNGWEAAAAADNVPIEERTDHGLPVRAPGARLIPGGANGAANGVHDEENEVASVGLFRSGNETGQHDISERDPEAIRASMNSHFGGVRAGRSHSRETSQGPDQE